MKIELSQEARNAAAELPSGDDLVAYFEKGQPPSDFLGHILANDFIHAVIYADHYNMPRLSDYARWLYLYGPRNMYGNIKKVQEHLTFCEENINE